MSGSPKLRRRDVLVGGAAMLGAGLLGCGDRLDAPGADAVQRRVLTELEVFTSWLGEHAVPGFVGEVGWPGVPAGDAERWNRVAEAWYRAADAAGLWVCNWAAGEWWGDYPLATYAASRSGGTLDVAGRQARVIEAHPTRDGVLRGVALAGGAFGFPSTDATSRFSNVAPGTLDVDYHYDGAESHRFLARRGVRLARLEFRWERIQPELGGELAPAELELLRAVVRSAGSAGLRVVLDLHNYASYYVHDGTQGVRRELGSPELPDAALADLWVRLSRAFRDEPVEALGLMNEPVGERRAARWESASRAAVAAVRAAGEERTVLVSGWAYSGVQTWREQHAKPWVEDERVRYEAHHYFDANHDSSYEHTYDQVLQAA